MRLLKPWSLSLRAWQSAAFDKIKETLTEGKKDFLCVATPGAGKTIFALRVAHHFLENDLTDRVIIICPTEHLKKQWADNAAMAGIDIDPAFENSRGIETKDFYGASLTYAQVGRAPKLHGNNCNRKRTVVIFDEIHHLGDNLSWGDSIKDAFQGASFRLAISGTPFRRDNNPIPFVTYKKQKSIADYTYGYSDAIREKVCRPVFFSAFEGEMEWRVKDKIYKSTFKDALDRAQASERLRTALDPDGQWLETVVRDADQKLESIRRGEQPEAGGLLIAIDQQHARSISRLLTKLTGEVPVIVVSDDPQASRKIRKFNKAGQKWIIAVKMVSEGVDIPRLRVGIYATNVKSELFFRQAVGRFVRVQKSAPMPQNAYIYIPKEWELVEYAKEIEIERDHEINKPETEFERLPVEKPEDKEEEEKEFEAISSIATDKISYELQFELDFGAAFAAPKTASIKKTDIKALHPPQPVVEEVPTFELIERLKKDINDLSRRYALKYKNGARVDWLLAHKEWLRRGGKSIDAETKEELEKRKKWLLDKL
jgi:superfamily II DNA or RNA helicase